MAASERQETSEEYSLRCLGVKPSDRTQMNSKRIDLVRNLINREMFGSFSRKARSSAIPPQTLKPLMPKSCFTFRLQDLIPNSALLKGHIVLGFSRCGQFLLTYTCSTYEASLGFTNRYVLHWWACLPRGKAKRVSEVTLFKDQGVDESSILYLALCQWPNDNTKMIIYGMNDPYLKISTQASTFYLTVTMVPSLHNCLDCQRVAATFEVEDLAANWDSCVRLSCLRHSATVHTSCEIVAPFPQFEPDVSLKLDGTIVINTGNFLHVLRINLESSDRYSETSDPLLQPTCRTEQEEEDLLSSLMLQNCELNQARGAHASPLMFLKSPQYFSSEEETEPPCEKRFKFYDYSESEDSLLDSPQMTTTKINKEKIFFLDSEPTPTPRVLKQLEEAEKVFEFIDENPPDIKLSAFRLRRLADKKYEFCADEDESENIVPYRRQGESPVKKHEGSPQPTSSQQNGVRRLPAQQQQLQQTNLQELSIYTSPPFSPSGDVLRPLNSNSLAVAIQQLGSPSPQQPDEHKGSPRPYVTLDLASPGGRCRTADVKKPLTYLVKLQRRYFEVDDEIVSVITDVEDDELGAMTGYHSALPLEVHGSGYAQMQMVSNTKAGKLRASCVLVQQTSFDIEQFCHEMAQHLCFEAGVKYWFCNDYDIEILDVCPNSGDVIVVAFLLLQATGKIKPLNKNQQRLLFGGVQRRTFQASFIFKWNLETGRYSLVRKYPLREQDPPTSSSSMWHPARAERNYLRRLASPLPAHPPVRCLSNRSVLKGVSLDTLLDLENHMIIILK